MLCVNGRTGAVVVVEIFVNRNLVLSSPFTCKSSIMLLSVSLNTNQNQFSIIFHISETHHTEFYPFIFWPTMYKISVFSVHTLTHMHLNKKFKNYFSSTISSIDLVSAVSTERDSTGVSKTSTPLSSMLLATQYEINIKNMTCDTLFIFVPSISHN